MPVSMHTTGKTIEGNPNYIYTPKINVIIGVQDNLLAVTKMGVPMNLSANIAMAGKNKSTIQITTS